MKNNFLITDGRNNNLQFNTSPSCQKSSLLLSSVHISTQLAGLSQIQQRRQSAGLNHLQKMSTKSLPWLFFNWNGSSLLLIGVSEHPTIWAIVRFLALTVHYNEIKHCIFLNYSNIYPSSFWIRSIGIINKITEFFFSIFIKVCKEKFDWKAIF